MSYKKGNSQQIHIKKVRSWCLQNLIPKKKNVESWIVLFFEFQGWTLKFDIWVLHNIKVQNGLNFLGISPRKV